MPVPAYYGLMLPLLYFAGDGQEHHISHATSHIGEQLNLNQEELAEMMSGGRKNKFYDRMQWAKTHLVKGKLLESTGRGLFRITQRGIETLKSRPETINRRFLMQFPEFREFIQK